MKLSVIKVKQFKHNKTGNVFNMLFEDIICTDNNEEKKYVLYVNSNGTIFCCEHDEFYNKFTKL